MRNRPARCYTFALLAVFFFTACAHPKHVAVVADTALYEALSDIHQLEQRALCGRPSCAGIPEVPISGWSHDESVAFNKTLLPAVDAGLEFNEILATWTPGQPAPERLRATMLAISGALQRILADFPAGTTRDGILAAIAQAERIIIDALNAYIEMRGR